MKEFFEEMIGSLLVGLCYGLIPTSAIGVVAIALKKEKWLEKWMGKIYLASFILVTIFVYTRQYF